MRSMRRCRKNTAPWRREIRRLESSGIPESAALNAMLTEKGTAAVKGSARLADLVRRPQIAL